MDSGIDLETERLAVEAGISPELFRCHRKTTVITPIKKEKDVEDMMEVDLKLPKINPIYNLRDVKKKKSTYKKLNSKEVALIKLPKVKSFRDILLAPVDINNYHLLLDEDEYAQKIIQLCKEVQKSQVDKFVYCSKQFVVMSLLGTARIFEYDQNENHYIEVKRLPTRFIDLSSKLITCIHYCDSKFYLAYLGGSEQEKADPAKPYIEIRNIFGKLLDKHKFYDHILTNIESDTNFIYVYANRDTVYIHRKDLFKTIYYKIDFTDLTTWPVIRTWVEKSYHDSYSKLILFTVTSREVLISEYDIFSHGLKKLFTFDTNQSNIVSVDNVNNHIIIHRTRLNNNEGKYPSLVDFGNIFLDEKTQSHRFIHRSTLQFAQNVVQVRANSSELYLFGYNINWDGSRNYEVGCMSLPEPRPLWIAGLSEVDDNCNILAHDDNVAIVKNSQEIASIRTSLDERVHCAYCNLYFLKEKDKIIHDGNHHQNLFSKYMFVNAY